MKIVSFEEQTTRILGLLLVILSIWVSSAGAQTVKPERKAIDVAIAAYAHTTIPMLIAQETGLFAKHGLTVNISVVSRAWRCKA